MYVTLRTSLLLPIFVVLSGCSLINDIPDSEASETPAPIADSPEAPETNAESIEEFILGTMSALDVIESSINKEDPSSWIVSESFFLRNIVPNPGIILQNNGNEISVRSTPRGGDASGGKINFNPIDSGPTAEFTVSNNASLSNEIANVISFEIDGSKKHLFRLSNIMSFTIELPNNDNATKAWLLSELALRGSGSCSNMAITQAAKNTHVPVSGTIRSFEYAELSEFNVSTNAKVLTVVNADGLYQVEGGNIINQRWAEVTVEPISLTKAGSITDVINQCNTMVNVANRYDVIENGRPDEIRLIEDYFAIYGFGDHAYVNLDSAIYNYRNLSVSDKLTLTTLERSEMVNLLSTPPGGTIPSSIENRLQEIDPGLINRVQQLER